MGTAGFLRAVSALVQQLATYPFPFNPGSVLFPLYTPSAGLAAAPLPINLAEVDAAHLVRIVAQPHMQLLVDCSSLPCQRTLGVCFLVSQLLVLRQSGASVWLRNPSPVLQHCLHKLQLSSFFLLAD